MEALKALLVIIKIGIVTVGLGILIYEMFKIYINVCKWTLKIFLDWEL